MKKGKVDQVQYRDSLNSKLQQLKGTSTDWRTRHNPQHLHKIRRSCKHHKLGFQGMSHLPIAIQDKEVQ
jgi:hypothetical protein